jgi:hypothetical protein
MRAGFHLNNRNRNSILYYLCAEPTAKRPITDTAQIKKNNNNVTYGAFLGNE